jgi:hypothetical protein
MSSIWPVVNSSGSTTKATVTQSSETTASLGALSALKGTSHALTMSIRDFANAVLQIPKNQSGNIMSLNRWRDAGTVTHHFLVLHATSPDGLPMYIRLDRRPMKDWRNALLLSSSPTAANDSVRHPLEWCSS